MGVERSGAAGRVGETRFRAATAAQYCGASRSAGRRAPSCDGSHGTRRRRRTRKESATAAAALQRGTPPTIVDSGANSFQSSFLERRNGTDFFLNLVSNIEPLHLFAPLGVLTVPVWASLFLASVQIALRVPPRPSRALDAILVNQRLLIRVSLSQSSVIMFMCVCLLRHNNGRDRME